MSEVDQSDISRKCLKDSVYIQMAKDISKLSRDENTQIGCVIVANDGSPVSWGYNGTLSGVDDKLIPHSREQKEITYLKIDESYRCIHTSIHTNKYPWMKHAEANAINFADINKLEGATLYVTAYPCHSCALRIASTGITRIVIEYDQDIDSNSTLNVDKGLTEAILSRKCMELCINGKTIQLLPGH